MLEVINVDEEGRFGGPERRIVNVARGLCQKSVKTTVIIPAIDSDRFVDYANSANVEYNILDITRLSLERSILFRYIRRLPYELYLLIKFFRAHDAVLVHVNGASQFKVTIAAKLSGKKVVWHLNNTYLKFPVKLLFVFLSRICADAIIHAGFRAGEYYNVAKRFKKLPVSNIEAPVLQNFFECKILDSLKDTLRISVIGGVNPAKSLEDVIEVADILKQSDVSYVISIAGKILPSQLAYKQKLSEMLVARNLEKEVKFLGEVNNVPELVENSDIILTMSNREASPTAVWEGLAAGRIVVSTDVGSVREHIESEVNGFVVAVGATKNAAEIIKNISNGHYLISEIATKARDTAISKFSISRISEQHRAIYEETLKR